jgi:LytS/YehU family sensor histidine kinase
VDAKKKIHLHIDISDYRYQVAPLLLMPVVENGIKHGLNRVEEDAFLDIHIRQEGAELQVVVTNRKVVEESKEKGIGLLNLQRRLQLQYPGEHRLHTVDEGNIFKAMLNVKLYAL